MLGCCWLLASRSTKLCSRNSVPWLKRFVYPLLLTLSPLLFTHAIARPSFQDKTLLEAARNAVDRHMRSQFSSGDETLLEIIENPDDADDPGARLKFPVVPDARTQEKLALVVAQLERERDQHTSFVDTSANSCFGLLTQW